MKNMFFYTSIFVLFSCQSETKIELQRLQESCSSAVLRREPERMIPAVRLEYSMTEIDSIILNSDLLHNQWNTYSSYFVFDSIQNQKIKMGSHNLWHLDSVFRNTISRGHLCTHVVSEEQEKVVYVNLLTNTIDIIPPIRVGSTLYELTKEFPSCEEMEGGILKLDGRGYSIYFLIRANRVVSINYLNTNYSWRVGENKFVDIIRSEYDLSLELMTRQNNSTNRPE